MLRPVTYKIELLLLDKFTLLILPRKSFITSYLAHEAMIPSTASLRKFSAHQLKMLLNKAWLYLGLLTAFLFAL